MKAMTARLIVCEKSGRWAAALRRQAGERELPIVEARSSEQAVRELETFPASLVAVEMIAASAAEAASRWSATAQRFPAARWIALLDEALANHELLFREAGALHIVVSPRDLSATVRLIRRHLARAPQSEMSLEESILARLPWPAANS